MLELVIFKITTATVEKHGGDKRRPISKDGCLGLFRWIDRIFKIKQNIYYSVSRD